MENFTIIEELEPSKGGYKIYFDGKKIIFNSERLFDRDTDEWDYFYGAFPLENYISGISELIGRGNCSINGERCKMELRKNPGENYLIFDFTQYLNPSQSLGCTMFLKKRAEDLRIPIQK